MELKDRVALVTGASSGIGKAAALALAREGCAVGLAARREDRLDAIVDEIGEAQAIAVPTDVTDEAAVTAMVDGTRDAFGDIDILVNNAGVLRPDRVADADSADFQLQLQVNLLGVMNAPHAALPAMLEASSGDIVVISSLNARHAAAGGSAYTATKFGVNGFCHALRKEVADEGVRVTIVMPGAVITEMRDWEDWDGRALDAADVAEAIVFAVSRPDHVSMPEIIVAASDLVW